MRSKIHHAPLLLAALFCLGLSGSLWAAPSTAAVQLLRLVPADARFCVLIQDLRSHRERLTKSPLIKEISRSPLGQAVATAPEWQQLQEVEKLLKARFGLTLTQIRDDFLGDAAVFAFRQGNAEMADQELFLLHLSNPAQGKNLLKRLRAEASHAEKRSHRGNDYYRIQEGTEVTCFFLQGTTLGFTSKEAMLLSSLELLQQGEEKQTALVTRFQQSLPELSLLTLWINPRSFDEELKGELQSAKGADAAFLRTFVACWKRLHGILFSLVVHQDAEIRFTLQGDPNGLPKPLVQFFDALSQRSELWGYFPENPIAAMAARIDLVALIHAFSAFQTTEAKKKMLESFKTGFVLGSDLLKDVFPYVGPDWGFYIDAPVTKETGAVPAMLLAMKAKPGPKKPRVDRGLVSWIRLGATFLSLAWNQGSKENPARMKTFMHQKEKITWISSTKGAKIGLQPTFGLSNGYLVFATDPTVFRAFAQRTYRSETEAPWAQLSFKAFAAYLGSHREGWIQQIVQNNKLSPKQAATALDGLHSVLKFFDKIELVNQSTKSSWSLVLRLKMVKPFQE